MTETPKPARIRKPVRCDSCRELNRPALGIGCPCPQSEAPAALRGVYLWHCGAPACEADCRARFAAKLTEAGRRDLAARLTGEASIAAPRPDPVADLPPAPGAARAARKLQKPRPADTGDQGALFGA